MILYYINFFYFNTEINTDRQVVEELFENISK